MSKNISILFLIGTLLIGGCTNEWEITPDNEDRRTLLVYLAGDNNLSDEVRQKTAALLAGWNPSLGKLLVFADTYGGRPVLMQAALRDGKTVSDTVQTYSETNSASPQLLREVIDDVRRLAPAKSYGMILFSHATGWLPQGAFENPLTWRPKETRSVFMDGIREMELADFAAAIPDGMFDFMAFDMCFMASVEAAYALRHKTAYMVASAPEILSPGFFPVYEKSLALLYRPEPDLAGFANAFYAYFASLEGVYRSAAISVIRTAQMEPLAQLAREINPQLSQTQTDNIQYYDRKGKPHLFFDLGDWLHTAAKTPEQHARIDETLARAVIFKRHTDKLINIDIKRHSGLSVYIPQAELPWLNKAYEKTEWAVNWGLRI